MTAKRPSFPKPTDETKRFAALLEAETRRWPAVRIGAMFGMVSLYRGKKIFALLPATRSLFAPDSIAVKGEKWEQVAVESEADLPRALERLGEAYERAGK